MHRHNYRCPRCQNIAIIEYELTIECPNCKLEFDKKDFDKFDNENILAIKEKKDVVEILKKD
jgi:rubredoxin